MHCSNDATTREREWLLGSKGKIAFGFIASPDAWVFLLLSHIILFRKNNIAPKINSVQKWLTHKPLVQTDGGGINFGLYYVTLEGGSEKNIHSPYISNATYQRHKESSARAHHPDI